MNADSLWPIVIAVLSVGTLAVLGAFITDLGPWYRALKQPWFKPPDWAFGPAWTTIFACTGTAGVMAWKQANISGNTTLLLTVFAINGVLNVLWSVLYFRFKRPDWAFYEVILFWLSIVAMIVVSWPYSHTASYLFLPYLVWVTFAATLNWATIKLNGPFIKVH
jgi:translocator protein